VLHHDVTASLRSNTGVVSGHYGEVGAVVLEVVAGDAKDSNVALVLGVNAAVVAGRCHSEGRDNGELLRVPDVGVTTILRNVGRARV
jgi:hypothetical protein